MRESLASEKTKNNLVKTDSTEEAESMSNRCELVDLITAEQSGRCVCDCLDCSRAQRRGASQSQ